MVYLVKDIKIANESQRIIQDYVAVILVLEENMPSAGRTGKEFVTNYKTYFSGQSLGATMSNLIKPNPNEILLLFIIIIGCVDIILLCAYLALCIHDRTGQDKTMDRASLRPNFPGRSTAYENIEFASFSVSEMNWIFYSSLFLVKIIKANRNVYNNTNLAGRTW